MEHRAILEDLVHQHFNGTLHNAEHIAGGHSGFVYGVEVEDRGTHREVCIKLTPWFEEPAYDALILL